MKTTTLSRLLLPAAAFLLCQPVRAALKITEFLASNEDSLTDEDGDHEDWIEIQNQGTDPVNLLNWRLSDNASRPDKWVFPPLNLAPGARLLVWASEKDRRDPARQLHTNFKLSSAGEYLGLFRPDGGLEYDFGAAYPPQFEDVSYGSGQASTDVVLVTAGVPGGAAGPSTGGTAGRWKVPADGNADVFLANGSLNPAPWIATGYDDSAWTAVTGGVGYDTNTTINYLPFIGTGGNCQAAMQNIRQSVYIRWTFNVADPAAIARLTLRMRFDDGFVAYFNGSPVLRAHWNDPANAGWSSAASALNDDAAAIVQRDFDIAGGGGALQAGTNVLCINGLNMGVGSSDLLMAPELIATVTSGPVILGYFSTPTPGDTNSSSTPNPGPLVKDVPQNLPRPGSPLGALGPVVTEFATAYSGVQGQGGWTYGYQQGAGVYDHVTGFIPFEGGTGTAYKSQYTTPGALAPYNYWSGSSWDVNTAAASPWTNISSTFMHPNDAAPGPLQFPIARWTSTVAGPHTLAGTFNRPATVGNGTTGRVFLNGTELFNGVTLGDTRSFLLPVTLAVGDHVDFMVDTGPADDDGSDTTNFTAKVYTGTASSAQIPITAKVVPTLNPLSGVRLKYQIMFGTEADVPMNDGGTAGDVTAGDGIYTGVMNVSSLGPGEMVRWRVVATDSTAVAGSAPPFPDPVDSPKYYGTVSQDARLSYTQLPVLHWFIQNPAGADNAAGARCALYYQENSAVEGEFYDNILMNTHGQSTSGFAKKSYDIDFNHDFRFRYKADAKRVKDINLLTNWADKAKVRNTLTWATYAETGSFGHFAFPVRVQRNGSFFSIADMVEDGDDRYLERAGLNPTGALYKMYNTLDSATSGVEKKTRRSENNNDLAAFITGLDTAKTILDRRRYAYDNLDIATTVNYLACNILTNSQDQGHKNYYLYRDSDGNGEWKPLPWDQDLSLGHTWTSEQNYFDDDVDSQRGLQNGATNRLKQFVYSSPEINKLFTRRLRTLTDKYFLSAVSTTGIYETKIAALLDRLDPPGAGTNSDAWLDFQAWGYWTDGNGGAKINPTQTGWDQHGPRASAARIVNANNPAFYPTSAAYTPFNYNGVNPPTTAPFLPGRRAFLYSASAASGADVVPVSQPANPAVVISSATANPGTGNQEYFVLRNNAGISVDISGWSVTGAVDYTFPGGTVMPPYTNGVENVGLLFVVRDANGFRNRTVSPKRNEFCFVTGPYHGQLSARGETIELRNDTGAIVNTLAIPAAPTAAQQSLRVTEILFKPAAVTAAERAAIPSVIEEDFEFIELMNTGASPLDISGAQFIEGITFTFPASTVLAPGARTLLVSNAAAFALRHPGVTNIAGQYTGQLDNNGETLDLIDAAGETILEFSYNDKWYPPTDQLGHSLIFLDPAGTPYNEWDKRTRWGVSPSAGGTPGLPETGTAMIYEVWANTAFTAADRDDPLIGDLTANPDGDLADNLLEYALSGQPKVADNLLQAGFITSGGQSWLALTFRRRISTLDIRYDVQFSPDLINWNTVNTPVTGPINHGDGTETITIGEPVLPNVAAHRFIRLKVSRFF